jgi:hypothetical protein
VRFPGNHLVVTLGTNHSKTFYLSWDTGHRTAREKSGQHHYSEYSAISELSLSATILAWRMQRCYPEQIGENCQ